MWFRLLATLLYVSPVAVGQGFTEPGEPAQVYADGEFLEPRGEQTTYTLGSGMNISWHTAYETSNLWLIPNYNTSAPIQIASNIGQTWYQWEVATIYHNYSWVYTFRIVNATGTTTQQTDGGFFSAAFWIHNLEATSTSSSLSTSSTLSSTSAPAATSDIAATSPAAASQATQSATNEQSTGLTSSAKVGVGVGVGVGGIGFIALIAGLLLYRRSRNNKTQANYNTEPYSQAPGATPANAAGSFYHKQPSELHDTARTAELDTFEFFNTQKYPRELPG